jgi:hypothetical protein
MTALTGKWCVRNVAFASSKRVIGGDRAGIGYRALRKGNRNAGRIGMSRAGRAMAGAGICLAAVLSFQIGPFQISPALSAAPLTVAIADFDYVDTSGEVKDQGAEHQARVVRFAELLREILGASGNFHVLPLECAEPPCTPVSMRPDNFIAASRRSGARFVVYGGIHKISTLVQWGDVQLLDLEADKVLFRQNVTFRGDTDEAYRRAAGFVGESVRDAMEKR